MPGDKTEAQTAMAIHMATGLPVLRAREFIRTSPPELVKRILEGEHERCFRLLNSVPRDLEERIQQASKEQATRTYLSDPMENDPETGPIIRRILEAVSREIEAERGCVMGLCHVIWHTTRERLLREHSIVWYSPAQMNPGSIFD
ncbi:MAG: hypothetical protein V4726_09975 [Verrucomicrobiota bacterium]